MILKALVVVRGYRVLVSVFVVIVLAAQLATLPATALLHPVGDWFWPISDYPMYAGPGYEGERVDSEYRIDVILDNGETRPVTKEDLGLNVFHFYYLANNIIGAKTPTGAVPLLRLLKNPDRVREVVVSSSGRVITRDGVSQQTPKVLARVDVRSGMAGRDD